MTKAFDRSRFKGTKLSNLQEKQEEAKKADVRLLGGNSEGRVGYHKVDMGRNEFRIAPPHNPEDLSYYPVRTTMLDCEVPKYEDGKETGEMEIRKKKIFIATVHGNEKLRELGKDPVELYIKYIGELAGDIDNKDDRTKFLTPVKGWRDKKGQWNWGIMPSTSFACYAWKNNELGRLELYETYMNEMNQITATMEDEQQEIFDFDIFSNPDKGFPLIIKKEQIKDEKSGKMKNVTVVSKGEMKMNEDWNSFFERTRVSDKQLMELSDKESLKDMFVDVYSKRDFDLAIDGLRRFDEKYKFQIFENEEFLDQLKEIEAVVPEPKKKDENEDATEAFNTEKAKEFTKIKAKKLLKVYINENYEDQEDQYLEALNELSNDELKEWYQLAMNDEELPELEEREDVGIPEDVEYEEEEQQQEESEEDVSSLRNARRSRRSNS